MTEEQLMNEQELDEELVMLEDEDGNEVPFHYITLIEHEGKDYIYLQPANEEEDADVQIYELTTGEEDGEEFDILTPVEDDLYEVLYTLLLKAINEQTDVEDAE